MGSSSSTNLGPPGPRGSFTRVARQLVGSTGKSCSLKATALEIIRKGNIASFKSSRSTIFGFIRLGSAWFVAIFLTGGN